MDLRDWLRSLGLERYEAAFRDNEIDATVLPNLTADDLKDLGVGIVGHRRKLLDAISALRADAGAKETALPAAGAGTTSSPDTAERRQVTVMFSDLVGSTALSARMDPEDLREVISAYQKCVAETVRRFGGFVAKYMGDGVLVYFGYPQAHEDDAERAVRAGLELIAAVAALKSSVRLQTRVGIATGLVVVGDLIGSGEAQERRIVGETPNLAARLQGIAEPDMVVIADGTRKLLGNLFELADLGAQELKGIAGPVRAFAALRQSSVESRFEALRASTTPLVGRDEEIALLFRRWDQAKVGNGQVVLISGEPGIGKSRIAHTMQERLGAEPHTCLRFFCSPHHQDSALYPAIAQLERAAGFRREDTADQRLAKLEAVLAQATNDVSETAPLITDLLSIPTGDRYPALTLTPQKRKEKTLGALVAQAEGLAARRPVLIIYEDVHWSDPTTRESLDLFIDRVPALRVLVIITFRPEFSPPWIERPHVTMLNLNRLPPRQRAEMIVHVTGGKALPNEITEQIVDRTDGIPLFIEELTKTVVESGIVTKAGDRYALAGPTAPFAIPTTLHASLLARLDRLAPTREVAQIGAALARSFSHKLINAVAQMPQSQLDGALGQLVSAELMFRRGTPPEAEYTFKHALVREAAYDTLLRSRRQQLHGRIVAVLEQQFPEIVATQPDLLARHCAEAGAIEKAIGYYLKAGQKSMARCAMTEAVAQLRKGLDLVSRIPEGATRAEQELDLQIQLGYALQATNGYAAPEPGEAFARARELCDQLNRPTQLAPILIGNFVFRLVRAELDEAERLARELRSLGETQNEGFLKFVGAVVCGNAYCWRGELTDARAHHENALALWDPKFRDLARSPEDYYVLALLKLSRSLLCLGYIDQARTRRAEGLAEARRLSPFTLAVALQLAWFVDWPLEGMKSASMMLQSADELIAISSEQGFPLWLAGGKIMRGGCLGAIGQATEGIPLILEGLAFYSSIGCRLMKPFHLITLAETYSEAGQPKEALDQLAEAANLIETTHERWIEADIHRKRGTLLQALGEHAAAEQCYVHALDAARRQNAKFWELRAVMSMARLLRDQCKRDAARDLLAPVYGWFTEGFDTLDLKEAKALLGELTA